MLEKLADLMHQQWCGWMEYLFSVSVENEDGSVTIPADKVSRWKRQMLTSYFLLPEEEKVSDRIEADKLIQLLNNHSPLEENRPFE